jgi:ribosomal protein S6--L-glutamate ligase
MGQAPYFVSLHHQIKLDENIHGLGFLDQATENLIAGAAGVLMPRYFSPRRYRHIASLARDHFPKLKSRYAFRGKASQIELFAGHSIPHPATAVLNSPEEVKAISRTGKLPMSLPFVLKGDSGGGGSAVFPIESLTQLDQALDSLPADEPVLIQEWIDHGGRDLRVVIMGGLVKSYFRVGVLPFYNNVSKGAQVDHSLDPELQRQGRNMALDISRATGIDLAAFDIMFPPSGPPLVVEVNFMFGTKGLGGRKGFQAMFRSAVQEWMERIRSQCLQPQSTLGNETK